ncbi:hypothetical protein OPKNFCMD_2760 [Methylobacterium crusticola]|uniref:Uncharacterized protein n=1 Tax=Methylobacterium crusticola TaxID=1697972 RepID=A0ABQ4QXS8_9HYPH|nr:hypothetical protein [Methylobacterium crusticola]GJD50024.1 hypothetical protein OPKNFCMD_2760 [Methylobacterium crusticola]
MTDRAECLRLLFEFVQSGDVEQAGTTAGTIIAYISTLPGLEAQVAALDDLRANLTSRCEAVGLSGEAEHRHELIEDAMEQARSTLEAKSASSMS